MANLFKKRYNQVWKHTPVQDPNIWTSWEVIKDFVGKKCLELGCGNYPKIPLDKNSFFLDLSEVAVSNLRDKGLNAYLGSAENLPFEDDFFDLVVAWEVLEHVDNDKKAFSEISRVLKNGGHFLFSVPLGKDKFGKLDMIAGHKRRYESEELERILKENNFKVLKFRCPCLFKYFEKIPCFISLTERLYSRPSSVRYFNLPKPLVNLFIRTCAFLGRLSSAPWETGPLKGLKEEININIFCVKRS